MTDTDPTADLRVKFVDDLFGEKLFRTADIDEAMRTVPRHVFLPGVPLEKVYSNEIVVTHRDSAGVATSSATAPGGVAAMLEQLEVRPGHRVLEVGAGTGYNAALLAYLVGPTGHVTTVDIDPDVTAAARRNLTAAGYERVRVVCGDGADGDPPTAPFDRIVVTAGAWDIPPAWTEQLAPGGRLVVPLRIRGLTRAVALERRDGHWHSVSVEQSGFIPMRGAGHQPEPNLRLDEAGGLILRIDDGQPADETSLRRALRSEPALAWSGVIVADREKIGGYGDLDYWLASLGSLCRLLVRSRDHGIVKPALAYGSMALLDGNTLAYLTKRPDGEASEYELGVCAYGPLAEKLAGRVAEVIRAWRTTHGTPAWIEVYPSGAPILDPDDGVLLVAAKQHVQVVVRTRPAQP